MFRPGGIKFKIKLFLIVGLTMAVIGAGSIPLSQILFPGWGEKDGSEATDSGELQLTQLYQAVEEIEKREPFDFQVKEPVQKETRESGGEEEILKIKILNGSGVTGAAGNLRDELTAEGISGDISLGNTEDTEITLIQMKESLPQSDRLTIINTIKADYPHYQEEKLSPDSPSDVVIVLGKS